MQNTPQSPLDIVALGELLIDFTPLPDTESGMTAYERNAGGAPANVLAACSKMGAKTALIAAVGCDGHGDFLRREVVAAGIDDSGLISTEKAFTTMAFVTIINGEREFAFARKPGADTQIAIENINADLLDRCKIFHCGSLSMTDNPSRKSQIFALEYAKNAGKIVSFDPNYRKLLWKSVAQATKMAKLVFKYADIVKLSDNECEVYCGTNCPETAAKVLLKIGASIALITLGVHGVLLATAEKISHISGVSVENIVDTTGAGDCFFGVFLAQIAKNGQGLREIPFETLENYAKTANRAAAICITRRGAIPSMPDISEL